MGTVRFRHDGLIRCLAFAPDGKTLVTTAFGDKKLRFWDAAPGKEQQPIESPQFPVEKAFDRAGKYFATSIRTQTGDETVDCDLATGKVVARVAGHQTDMVRVATIRPRKLLRSGKADRGWGRKGKAVRLTKGLRDTSH
jgi:WD40 repeat protein